MVDIGTIMEHCTETPIDYENIHYLYTRGNIFLWSPPNAVSVSGLLLFLKYAVAGLND